MRLYPEKLEEALKNALLPCYLVHGEELLLVEESIDLIRAVARQKGFDERIVFDVNRQFDWAELNDALDSFSLFATQKIIELRFDNLPDAGAKKQLEQAFEKLGSDVLLILRTGKIDASAQKAKWFKALDKIGVNIPCWPVGEDKLPSWVKTRARMLGIKLDGESLQQFCHLVEGNLFAARQELEKLALLYPESTISLQDLQNCVADNARYHLFTMLDTILAGHSQKALTMLTGLRAENVHHLVFISILARELRTLIRCSMRLDQGESAAAVLAPPLVWQNRRSIVLATLKRHKTLKLQRMLNKCSALDALSKGQGEGNVWDELQVLILMLASVNVWTQRVRS